MENTITKNKIIEQVPTTDEEIREFLKDCYQYKPSILKIDPLRWRFALRSVLRGDNLLVRGDSGFGKTMLATTLAEVFGRPFFPFNLGATQDPHSFLIGNTHLSKEIGTFVAESYFVKAIQTPNAVILLDEVSRAHPDAHNILMSVLDKRQRYLRIDEKPETPTIKVAPGVTFIGTANVGVQYTATREMDLALLERFVIVVMPHLSKDLEVELLTEMYPMLDPDMINAVAEIATLTRNEVKLDNPHIDTVISTRSTTEMGALMCDGFTLEEVAEIKIYPYYTDQGGVDSPQTFVREIVQRFIRNENIRKKAAFGALEDPNEGREAPFS